MVRFRSRLLERASATFWILQKATFRLIWLSRYLFLKLLRKVSKGFRRLKVLRSKGLRIHEIIFMAPAAFKELTKLVIAELIRVKKQSRSQRLRDKKTSLTRNELIKRDFALERLQREYGNAIVNGDTSHGKDLLASVNPKFAETLTDDGDVETLKNAFIQGNVLLSYKDVLVENSKSGRNPNWKKITKRNIKSAKRKLRRNAKSVNRKGKLSEFSGQEQCNLLIASHKHTSFMFLLPIIERLEQNENINIRTIDISVLHSPPIDRKAGVIPAYADELIEWSDVVFVEWANNISSWFVDQISPKKKIILRLHSYELLNPWPLLFDWGKIEHLICVADHNLNRLLEVVQPEEYRCKVSVLPNIFEVASYRRPKNQCAERTMGLVGYGSQNKRVDLALDLLEELHRQDSSWKLKLVGSPPSSSEEIDYFQQFFDRAAPHIESGHLIIDPWTPDLASWFESIGIILSCSDREGTHESCREGIASGCVAVIRRWPWASNYGGNVSMFPDSFIWNRISEAAEYLHNLNIQEGILKQGSHEQESFFLRESPKRLMAELEEIITS